jgi:cytochrome c553
MRLDRLVLAAALAAMPAAFVPASAIAADLGAGKKKATEICQSCHGLDGNSTSPDFPRLAGQHPDYLEKALRDYKSGARKNPIMAGFAAALTRAEIQNLAAYYASQPPALYTKR